MNAGEHAMLTVMDPRKSGSIQPRAIGAAISQGLGVLIIWVVASVAFGWLGFFGVAGAILYLVGNELARDNFESKESRGQ